MFNPLSAGDTDRTSRLAAFAVCVLAGLLCIWFLARLVWLLVPRGSDASASAPASSSAAAVPISAATSVAQWHLFGNAQAIDLAERALNAPKTALKLGLRGTLALPDPKDGIAIIADEQGLERSYNVGSAVGGSAKLTEVYTDHVVLSHDGVVESLNMPRPEEHVPPTAERASARGTGIAASVPPGYVPNAPSNSASPGAGNSGNVMSRMNAADLARQVQFEPVFEGGKIAGARLSGSGAAAVLMNQVGLKPSDVVTAVNGTSLSSVSNPQQLLDKLGNASSLQVTVQRDGKPATLTLNLR